MTSTAMPRRRRTHGSLAVVAAAVSVATGCLGPPTGALARSGATITPRTVHSPHILAATWTDGPWPFTVAEGDLGCTNEDRMQIQTFTASGITYALNRAAKDTGRYPAVDAIWRQDPDLPANKINIAEVIDYARTLCPD